MNSDRVYRVGLGYTWSDVGIGQEIVKQTTSSWQYLAARSPWYSQAQAALSQAVSDLVKIHPVWSDADARKILFDHMDAAWFTRQREGNYWGHGDFWVGIKEGSASDPGAPDANVSIGMGSAKADNLASTDIGRSLQVLYDNYRLKPLAQALAAAKLAPNESAPSAQAKTQTQSQKAAVLASAKAQIAANIQKSAAVEQEKLAKKFAIAAAVLGGLAIAYKLSKKK